MSTVVIGRGLFTLPAGEPQTTGRRWTPAVVSARGPGAASYESTPAMAGPRLLIRCTEQGSAGSHCHGMWWPGVVAGPGAVSLGRPAHTVPVPWACAGPEKFRAGAHWAP